MPTCLHKFHITKCFPKNYKYISLHNAYIKHTSTLHNSDRKRYLLIFSIGGNEEKDYFKPFIPLKHSVKFSREFGRHPLWKLQNTPM